MRGLGLILYANERYGNTYAVNRPSLDALFARASSLSCTWVRSPGSVP